MTVSTAAGKCPICGKLVKITEKFAPFCSARCKTIDLGAWAAEEYVVSRPLNETDEKLDPGRPDDTALDD